MLRTRTGSQDRKHLGFSLIELLIVVAIILIIAAIAIPNLLRARLSANESSAVASVRSISTAQALYQINYPTSGYGSLIQLSGADPCTPSSANACLVDNSLASGVKSGYNFDISLTGSSPVTNYLVTAVPQVVGSTGQRSFCSGNPASLHQKANGTAIASNAECEALPGF
ncbi:MAG TPA: prepilin-type N-terminal cleavage/methylation domain-containing protein [Terriglobales bacterium]|nr:prepilin-type N-terminal cleavage/methylation domain-containing protein [Terriglobales bacterium]